MFGIPEVLLFLVGLALIYYFARKLHLKGRKLDSEDPKTNNPTGTAERSVPAKFQKGLSGTARSVERQDLSGGSRTPASRVSFRLERVNETGDVIAQIPVEISQARVSAVIPKDGDSLIVLGRRNRQGVLVTQAVFNLTTHAELQGKEFSFFDALAGGVLGLFVIIAAIGVFLGLLLSIPGFGLPEKGVPLLIGSVVLLSILGYIARKRRLD